MQGGREAEGYLQDLNPKIRVIASVIDKIFDGLGCESYVKTIYIGYELDGEMVAALYGHSDHVEVALALSDEADGPLLVDASHLTWRTLPVAAIVRSRSELSTFEPLARSAMERVRTHAHDVNRDSEFFMDARIRRRGP
jgi:hypothetical protein